MNQILLILTVLLSSLDAYAVRYEFQGENYNNVIGSNYSDQMRLEGFLEFADVLEPNSTYPISIISGYEFNDGLKILNQSNSEVSGGSINTDSSGLPYFYRLILTKTPISNTVGETVSRIELYFGWNTEGFERNEGGYTASCLTPGVSTCTGLDDFTDLGEFRNPGLGGAPLPNWTLAGVGGSTLQVPINNIWALMFLAVVILVLPIPMLHRNNN